MATYFTKLTSSSLADEVKDCVDTICRLREKGTGELGDPATFASAKGFAIIRMTTTACIASVAVARGLIIARFPNGKWSSPVAIGSVEYGIVNAVGRITEFSLYFLSDEDIEIFKRYGRGNWKYPDDTSRPAGESDTITLLTWRKASVLGAIAKSGRPLPVRSRDRFNKDWYRAGVTREELLSGERQVPVEAQSLIHALKSNGVKPGPLTTKRDMQPIAPALVVSAVLFLLFIFEIQHGWHLLFV